MIIEIRNYKYFSLFLISFLFLFTSIIPFLEGSLFDYTFLLGSIPLWIFNILNRKIFSRVEILILIYFLISTIQLFSLILVDAQLFISSIPIYLRINGTLIIFDLLLFTILRNKNKSNLYLNYFLLFPFSLFTLLVSSWGVINSLRGVSWRLGFPLYSDGLDPHVFGPAMACAFIGLFYIFINFKDYYDGKNKNLLRILICWPIGTVLDSIKWGTKVFLSEPSIGSQRERSDWSSAAVRISASSSLDQRYCAPSAC